MFALAYTRALNDWLRTGVGALLLALAPACSVVNNDHCGNQDGNATCLQRDAATPYCSICVADNNGCLAADPGTGCLAETAPATSVDPTTSTSPSTTVTPTTDTTTSEPPTTTTTPNPTTTGDTTQTSEPGDTSTTTPDPTTGTSTSTSTSGPDTDTSTSGDTTMSSGSDSGSDSSSSGGTLCGNNMIDGNEVCDGTDLDMKNCAKLLPDKWGGGVLKCNDCESFNDTECCIGVGQKCDPLKPSEACCGGLKCKAAELLVNRCQN